MIIMVVVLYLIRCLLCVMLIFRGIGCLSLLMIISDLLEFYFYFKHDVCMCVHAQIMNVICVNVQMYLNVVYMNTRLFTVKDRRF